MVSKRTRVAAIVLVLGIAGCGVPAQIGPDPEVFKTIDALYTAVSLRDPNLVDSCLERLKDYREGGKLPDDAFLALEAMIEEGKGGAWEDAQTQLNRFMQGQRRGR